MNVRLDALVAEIARILDASLLRHDPEFAKLTRAQRMHFITRSLAARDIARGEKYGGRKVKFWRPSRRVEGNIGVRDHGIPDKVERIEGRIGFSTLFDELSELLDVSDEPINRVTDYVVRLFGMYAMGLLEYRGK